MPLSDAKIRALHSTDKPYKVGDFDGLFLLVKLSGAKSWRFNYRTLNKEKLLVIGDYPAISLAFARQARGAARADLAKGVDPNDIKQHKALMEGEAKAQTFDRVAEKYMAKITKEGRAPALLHKSGDGRGSPFPGQTYPTASVTGMPRAMKPFRTATRTWNSAT